jgi:hypothetical protein
MGIIGHEAPRLSSRGPVPYPAYDVGPPLEAGMVISVETTLLHPVRGFIKLEDTLAVTETGFHCFSKMKQLGIPEAEPLVTSPLADGFLWRRRPRSFHSKGVL